jgi:putative hydrolase of the HAD superfamily
VTFAPPALEAIFLDVGNTLVSMDFALLCDVLATHGVSCTPETLARAEAATRPALSRFLAAPKPAGWHETFTFYVDGMLARLGGVAAATRDVLAPRLATEIRAQIPTQRLWSAVLPGVPEALAQLRAAGLTVVAVSNSDGTVEQGLETFGLRQYLHHVVDSAVVGAEKPDVAIFHHALALAGSAPERTLHVGDLYAVDVLGARAAGLHALLLDPHGDWTDVDCDVVADVPALAATITG